MTTSVIRAGGTGVPGVQTTGGDDGALALKVGPLASTVEALNISSTGTGAFVGQVTATGFTGTLDGILGSGTAAAATVTTFTSNGIDDNADAIAITIDSSENVGVGTTTMNGKFNSVPKSTFNAAGTTWAEAALSTAGGFGGGLSMIDGSAGYILSVQDSGATFTIRQGTVGSTPAERMRIDSAGNVGIGTSSPLRELDVSSATAEIAINSTGSSFSRVNHFHNGTAVWTTGTRADSDYHIYRESGSGNVIIDSGNVGIGTTSPTTYANGLPPVLAVGTSNNFATIQGRTDGPTGATNGASFGVSYSTNPINGARIWMGSQGSAGQQGMLAFETKVLDDNTSQPLERMRIDASGKVGIGTAAPGFKVEIVGGTNDGIHIKDAASATVFGGLFTQSTALALVTRSNHALSFGTNDQPRMIIDNGGKVGIGTSSPGALLTVTGITANTADGVARFIHPGNQSYGTILTLETNGGTDAPALGFQTYNGGSPAYYSIAQSSSGALTFNAGAGVSGFGTERMRLNSAGQLLIGKATASAAGSLLELHTAGNVSNVFYMLKAGQVEMTMGFKTSGDSNFYVGTGSTTVGNTGQGVYLSNGGTSWVSNSDFRKKKNLVPIENALDKIANCRAMTGHFNNEADDVKKRPFLIAQDWVTALPEAVDQDTVDDDGVENLGLSYEGTVPLLVAAIKELREQNIALTNRITALEG